MSWLDLVLASPAIGVTIEPAFRSQHKLVERTSPLMRRWTDEKIEVTLGAKDMLSIHIGSSKGVVLQATNTDLVAVQQWAPKLKPQAGGLPTLDVVEVVPFSAALQQLQAEFQRFTEHVVDEDETGLVRCGLVADCHIDTSVAPPAVLRLLEHLEYPWVKGAGRFDVTILAILSEGNDRRDQCHHSVTLDRLDGDPKDLKLRLDWQRVFTSPKKLKSKQLLETVAAAIPDALGYFDTFGNGQLRYGSQELQ